MLPFPCGPALCVSSATFNLASGPQPPSEPAGTRPPTRGAEIGVVTFLTHRGERAEAILDGEGRWRCPVLPVLDRVLNALHAPRRGDLPFGHAELIRVAAWLKGA